MISSCTDTVMQSTNNEGYHKLQTTWVLWYHLPSNPDWTINGYNKICEFNYVEDVVNIIPIIPESIITSCCIFIMKKGILPIWEDKFNCTGGAFSYRISNKYILDTFRDFTYVVVGEKVSTNRTFNTCINGLTISPKKNFCVVKLWMRDISQQNPALITNEVKNLVPTSAIFKIHDEKSN